MIRATALFTAAAIALSAPAIAGDAIEDLTNKQIGRFVFLVLDGQLIRGDTVKGDAQRCEPERLDPEYAQYQTYDCHRAGIALDLTLANQIKAIQKETSARTRAQKLPRQ